MKSKKIEYIDEELKKFQFNRCTIGYKCIKKGLYIAIKEPFLLYNLSSKLYYRIANDMKLEKRHMKWNIERTINQMFINTDMKVLMKYFSLDDNEKVTPKLFFTTIIDKYIIK